MLLMGDSMLQSACVRDRSPQRLVSPATNMQAYCEARPPDAHCSIRARGAGVLAICAVNLELIQPQLMGQASLLWRSSSDR